VLKGKNASHGLLGYDAIAVKTSKSITRKFLKNSTYSFQPHLHNTCPIFTSEILGDQIKLL